MSSKNLSEKEDYDLSYPEGKAGFTITQLTMSILLLVLIVAIAIVGFKIVVAKANRITLQHDLENFVKAQDIFRADHKYYLGKAGEFIMYGKPPAGKLAIPELLFLPSEDVMVVITSGDGKNYIGPPVFKAMVKHNRSGYTYEYDFSTRKITERKN
jgi:type II secretory pathway pseudopilin PulG